MSKSYHPTGCLAKIPLLFFVVFTNGFRSSAWNPSQLEEQLRLFSFPLRNIHGRCSTYWVYTWKCYFPDVNNTYTILNYFFDKDENTEADSLKKNFKKMLVIKRMSCYRGCICYKIEHVNQKLFSTSWSSLRYYTSLRYSFFQWNRLFGYI